MAYYHLFWDDQQQEPYVVKKGFSFFAFLFETFYFLYHRAWISAGAFLAATVAVASMMTLFSMPESVLVFISFAFKFYVGFDASDCLFGEYHKKGYRYLKSDFYPSRQQATAEIFKLESV